MVFVYPCAYIANFNMHVQHVKFYFLQPPPSERPRKIICCDHLGMCELSYTDNSGWLPVGLENLKPSSKHVSWEMPQCHLSETFRNVVLGLHLSVNKQFQILIRKRGTTPPFSSKPQSQTFFHCPTTFYGSLARSTLSRDINTYLQHSHSSL